MDYARVVDVFKVGTSVRVSNGPDDKLLKGGLPTCNMYGDVRMVHEGSGVCVRLFISRIYQPRFWYKPEELSIDNRTQTLPVDAEWLESALGARAKVWLTMDKQIAYGCIRSWLLQKAGARPESGIWLAAVSVDEGVSKVSAVGVGMRTHAGIASTMFEALANAQINIENISTSEIVISCIVRRADGPKALRFIHDAFHLGEVGNRTASN